MNKKLDSATSVAWSFYHYEDDTVEEMAMRAWEAFQGRVAELTRIAESGNWRSLGEEILDLYDTVDAP